MVAYRSYVAGVDPEMKAATDALLKELGLNTTQGRAASTSETWRTYWQRLAVLRETHPGVTLSQFVDHIDQAVAVAGIDHVGLSGDFDGGDGVQGWDNAAESPNVTRELLQRGYSESDITKLWGANILRVMRDNEALVG